MITDLWLDYEEPTEIPQWFSRWSITTGVAALLGRQCSIEFGSSEIFPNIYTMLIGSSGSRKSSAINSVKHLLGDLTFNRFASTRVTKEQFLLELAAKNDDDILGFEDIDAASEMFIVADEANDFFGINNVPFLSMLGQLWDWPSGQVYASSSVKGAKANVYNPVINLLSGNTRSSFFQAFPPEIFGQGFFSRLLLIYGVPVDHKITFPEKDKDIKAEVINQLADIKCKSFGKYCYLPEAKEMVNDIYQNWKGFSDIRFESYKQRRLIHLSKLMLNSAVMHLRGDSKIHPEDVIYANSLLSVTEAVMPRAIEGMGAGRNAVLNQKVLEAVDSFLFANKKPATPIDLWSDLLHDFQSISAMMDVIQGLKLAKKLNMEGAYILPVLPSYDWLRNSKYIDLKYFRKQELRIIGGAV
jgi:hypothetical protein